MTLLSHYWREDDPVELTAAIGRDWALVLEGLPQDIIERACLRYLRNEPRRKPTPGAIYEMARNMMPRPVVVSNARKSTPKEDAEYQARVNRENVNPERKAEAERILAQFGMGQAE